MGVLGSDFKDRHIQAVRALGVALRIQNFMKSLLNLKLIYKTRKHIEIRYRIQA